MEKQTDRIKQILSKYLDDFSEDRNGQLAFYCINCHHRKKKLSVSINENLWHCWVCDFSGKGLQKLIKKVNASQNDISSLKKLLKSQVIDDNEVSEIDEVHLPNDFKSILFDNNNIYRKNVLRYAKSRRLDKKNILRYNLGYSLTSRYLNYLIIPSYDINGRLNFFQARNIIDDDNRPKYLNPFINRSLIIPFELYVNWKKPIILVEGFFDMNSNFNCLPLFGSYIIPVQKQSMILLKKILECETPSIYIMLDSDAIDKTFKIAEKIYWKGIETYYVDIGDKKEPDELLNKEFQHCIDNATKITESVLMYLRGKFVKKKTKYATLSNSRCAYTKC